MIKIGKANSIEGNELFVKMLSSREKIIDIGSGPKEIFANHFRKLGHIVDVCDFHKEARYRGDFDSVEITETYDAVWSSHCLEHQLNVNRYLLKIHKVLREGGLLCITVPPGRSKIVGGHVSVWNAGLVLFNLIAAGFNCKNAKIKTYGYNISIIVRKESIIPLPSIEKIQVLNNIREFFPKNIDWIESEHGAFDGNIKELNWNVDE